MGVRPLGNFIDGSLKEVTEYPTFFIIIQGNIRVIITSAKSAS